MEGAHCFEVPTPTAAPQWRARRTWETQLDGRRRPPLSRSSLTKEKSLREGRSAMLASDSAHSHHARAPMRASYNAESTTMAQESMSAEEPDTKFESAPWLSTKCNTMR